MAMAQIMNPGRALPLYLCNARIFMFPPLCIDIPSLFSDRKIVPSYIYFREPPLLPPPEMGLCLEMGFCPGTGLYLVLGLLPYTAVRSLLFADSSRCCGGSRFRVHLPCAQSCPDRLPERRVADRRWLDPFPSWLFSLVTGTSRRSTGPRTSPALPSFRRSNRPFPALKRTLRWSFTPSFNATVRVPASLRARRRKP